MQTTVLKVSLTFDPKALAEWAKKQRGVCCNEPAHDDDLIDAWEPEVSAQSILAHALLSAVGDVIEGGMVETLETGIPPEIVARREREYQAAFQELEEETL